MHTVAVDGDAGHSNEAGHRQDELRRRVRRGELPTAAIWLGDSFTTTPTQLSFHLGLSILET